MRGLETHTYDPVLHRQQGKHEGTRAHMHVCWEG